MESFNRHRPFQATGQKSHPAKSESNEVAIVKDPLKLSEGGGVHEPLIQQQTLSCS